MRCSPHAPQHRCTQSKLDRGRAPLPLGPQRTELLRTHRFPAELKLSQASTGKGFTQPGPTYLSHDPISPGEVKAGREPECTAGRGKTKGQFIPEQSDKSKSGPGS